MNIYDEVYITITFYVRKILKWRASELHTMLMRSLADVFPQTHQAHKKLSWHFSNGANAVPFAGEIVTFAEPTQVGISIIAPVGMSVASNFWLSM